MLTIILGLLFFEIEICFRTFVKHLKPMKHRYTRISDTTKILTRRYR
jgi:hypothetical protein